MSKDDKINFMGEEDSAQRYVLSEIMENLSISPLEREIEAEGSDD